MADRDEVTVHALKTDSEVFKAVENGSKTHEIRYNDRDFKVGDHLLLRETVHTGEGMKAGAPLHFTGANILKTVSHVLTGYGLKDGWVILSFSASTPPAEQVADSGEAVSAYHAAKLRLAASNIERVYGDVYLAKHLIEAAKHLAALAAQPAAGQVARISEAEARTLRDGLHRFAVQETRNAARSLIELLAATGSGK